MWRWIALLVLAAATLAGVVWMQPRASAEWKEFAIGPASGWSLSINPGMARGDGASLVALVAWIHGFQAKRVIGPEALQSRYTIRAVPPEADLELLRALLRRELEARFHLVTHVEKRSFDVWVLTAAHPVLTASTQATTTSWIYERNARLTGATMASVASTLQTILGKPVVDETGIAGQHDLEFSWGEQVERSTVAVMRDQFGLVLTMGQRELDALIVDQVQPDLSLKVSAAIGRASQGASPRLRSGIARVLMGPDSAR